MKQCTEQNVTSKNTMRSRVQRMGERLLRLLGLIGLGLATAAMAAPSSAQSMPQSVPQHWVSYAQLTAHHFQLWLSDPNASSVQRLHAWMKARPLKEGQPVPPLVVRVWVARNGQVERVEFGSLGQEQVDADLRSLLTAQALPEPPPDMRQPMVLQLDREFVGGT